MRAYVCVCVCVCVHACVCVCVRARARWLDLLVIVVIVLLRVVSERVCLNSNFVQHAEDLFSCQRFTLTNISSLLLYSVTFFTQR